MLVSTNLNISFQTSSQKLDVKYISLEMPRIAKTQIVRGGAKRRLSLFGFYVLKGGSDTIKV